VLGIVRDEAARAEDPAITQPTLDARRPGQLVQGIGMAMIFAVGAAALPGAHTPDTIAGRSSLGARVSLHRIGSRAELHVSRMPEPPAGKVYEVWVNRPGAAPRSTDALFTVTSVGDGTIEVPGGLRGVSSVMVTREPRGGSSTPTSAAVLSVAVHRRP
jgi:hypothetical protein